MLINTINDFAEKQDKSLYQIIQDTGLAPNTIWFLGRDKKRLPTGKTLSRLCATYNVRPWEFIDWVPEKTDG